MTGPVYAAAECSDTPAAGNRIECKEAATSTSDIDINAGDVDIDTTTVRGHGIFAEHRGTGDITVTVEQGMDIDTTGDRSGGILGSHRGTGDVTVKVKGLTGKNTIDTGGIIYSNAVEGNVGGLGNVTVTVEDAILTMTGLDARFNTETARGVSGSIFPQYATPLPPTDENGHPGSWSGLYNVDITVDQTQISTVALGAYGIYGRHEGLLAAYINGTINLTVTDTDVTTTGRYATGIRTRSQYGIGGTMLNMTGGSVITAGNDASAIYLFGRNSRSGDIISNVANASLTTKGISSHGIQVRHGFGRTNRPGIIKIDARNVIIASEGTGLSSGATLSHGILGFHVSNGDIDIDARGGSITTAGAYSYGIAGYKYHYGDILIDTHGDHTITNTGLGGHGIVAYHFDVTDPDRRTVINIEGEGIEVSGAGGQGVRAGALSSGAAVRFASLDSDGYRRQTVTVNGQVTSTAEGVFLANGGRVIIGPQGRINSGSGIAILATGDIPADNSDVNNVIPAIKPKLRVDLNLDGRKVEQALGDDNWIINDGGETTIAVNSTVLHEGATGFTGLTAPNGAWNVTMREHGVKVTNRTATDPADWVSTLSTSSAKIIADRDFNAQDFTETEARVECSDTPAPGNRIECKEDAASTTDININAGDVDIDTTGERKHAIFAEHRGTGAITVTVEQGMDLDVSGNRTMGIFGSHRGTGDVTVKVKGLTGKNTIDTGGITFSRAVEGASRGLGNVNITVKDAILKTTGLDARYNTETARGVVGRIFPDLATPPPTNGDGSIPPFPGLYNVDITVGSTQISTVGLGAYGIYGWHEGLLTTARYQRHHQPYRDRYRCHYDG